MPKAKSKPGRKRLTTDLVKKVTVTLTTDLVEKARSLGGETKNLSAGVRAAIEQAKEPAK